MPFLPSSAAAAVATGRPSSVVVLTATGPWARGEAAIVVTTAARVSRDDASASVGAARTLLATVEAAGGRVLHDPARGVGTFGSESEALRVLSDIWGGGASLASSRSPPPFRVLARGCALLGYLRGGARSGAGRAVLLATGARVGAQLPGGHLVRAVTSAAWVPLPSLPENENENENDGGGGGGGRSRSSDVDRGGEDDDGEDDAALSALAEAASRFKLDGSHYYCETADVTRPFPGRRGIRRASPPGSCPAPCPLRPLPEAEDGDGGGGEDAPSWEFVWNAAVSAPLLAAGLGDAVPRLLQGVAESRSVAFSREKKREGDGDAAAAATCTTSRTTTAAATLVLLTRASRLHAGTRYRARGLNALASPGNEVEVEQILWCADDDGGGGGGGGDGNSGQRNSGGGDGGGDAQGGDGVGSFGDGGVSCDDSRCGGNGGGQGAGAEASCCAGGTGSDFGGGGGAGSDDGEGNGGSDCDDVGAADAEGGGGGGYAGGSGDGGGGKGSPRARGSSKRSRQSRQGPRQRQAKAARRQDGQPK